MKSVSVIIGVLLGSMITCMILTPIYMCVGAFAGWAAGAIWPATVANAIAAIGINGLQAYQIGAAFGFLNFFLHGESIIAVPSSFATKEAE